MVTQIAALRKVHCTAATISQGTDSRLSAVVAAAEPSHSQRLNKALHFFKQSCTAHPCHVLRHAHNPCNCSVKATVYASSEASKQPWAALLLLFPVLLKTGNVCSASHLRCGALPEPPSALKHTFALPDPPVPCESLHPLHICAAQYSHQDMPPRP